MKVTSIRLDGEELPTEVGVVMTLDEVVVLARWTGELTGRTSPAPKVTNEIYDALVGSVINRFWDDGVNDLTHVCPNPQPADEVSATRSEEDA